MYEIVMKDQSTYVNQLVIPTHRDGTHYSVDTLWNKQKTTVYTAVGTVAKILNNDPTYKSTRATVMSSGGTRKSAIIKNNVIVVAKSLAGSNDMLQIAAPLVSTAFNIKWSTIHNILDIAVNHQENPIPGKQ